MRKEYYKLVRNKVPLLKVKEGTNTKVEVLSDNNLYRLELESVLDDKVEDLKKLKSVDNFAELLEVIKALAELQGISMSDVINVNELKCQMYGDYSDRIYLEYEEII